MNDTPSTIEIHGGIVSGCTIADAKGTRPVLVPVHRRFFVDVVEADGSRIGMWDGTSYDEAIIAAYELGCDFGASVVDAVISAKGGTDAGKIS